MAMTVQQFNVENGDIGGPIQRFLTLNPTLILIHLSQQVIQNNDGTFTTKTVGMFLPEGDRLLVGAPDGRGGSTAPLTLTSSQPPALPSITAAVTRFPVPLVFEPDVSGPSTGRTGNVNVILFPDAALNGGEASVELPEDVDLTKPVTLQFDLYVTSAGAGDADVALDIQLRYLGDGELATKALDENPAFGELTIPIIDTVARRHRILLALDTSKLSKTRRISVDLQRAGTATPDTFTGVVGLAKQGSIQLSLKQ